MTHVDEWITMRQDIRDRSYPTCVCGWEGNHTMVPLGASHEGSMHVTENHTTPDPEKNPPRARVLVDGEELPDNIGVRIDYELTGITGYLTSGGGALGRLHDDTVVEYNGRRVLIGPSPIMKLTVDEVAHGYTDRSTEAYERTWPGGMDPSGTPIGVPLTQARWEHFSLDDLVAMGTWQIPAAPSFVGTLRERSQRLYESLCQELDRRRQSEPPEHLAMMEPADELGGTWLPKCSCGWETFGVVEPSYLLAMDRWKLHKEEEVAA
jgi:hypothetical protein